MLTFLRHLNTPVGNSYAYKDGENEEKNNINFSFQDTEKTLKCLVFPLFVLTCRYLTGDVTNCRDEKQESQEKREKCIHVLKRGRVLSL